MITAMTNKEWLQRWCSLLKVGDLTKFVDLSFFRFYRFTQIFIVVLGLSLFGCQAPQKSADSTSQRDGKGAVEEPSQAPEVEKPPPPVPRAPRVGLILGPGGLKSFAHLGILKELDHAKISVDMIIGLEWGALIGALYSVQRQVHEAEWKLFKLKEEHLFEKGFFNRKNEPIAIRALDPFLKEAFETRKMTETQVEFHCPSRSLLSGVVVWQDKGDLQGAIRRCVAYPPFYSGSGGWVASPFAVKESIERLKSHGMDVIVFVNVLEQGELLNDYGSAVLWTEVRSHIGTFKKGVHEYSGVHTKDLGIVEFEKRREFVQMGERAGRDLARRLVKRYGL